MTTATLERFPTVPGRAPRLIPQSHLVGNSTYTVVVCNGTRKNGKTCNRMLGELNLDHPHDVTFRCQDCGATYLLQKGI